MAKVTWIGEGTSKENPGPSSTTWQNMTFEKGEPVEITDLAIITKAKGNRFFKVEEDEPPVHQQVKAVPDVSVAAHTSPTYLHDDDVPVKRGPGRPPKVHHDDEDSR